MFKIKNKNISTVSEKILIILISLLIGLIFLYGGIEYTIHYFKKDELTNNIDMLNKDITELEQNKNSLSQLSPADITKVKSIFENKKYNEEILKFQTEKIEILGKVLRKDTNKFYVTIKVPFQAEKEIDLRKYLLLQSLNKKIYKLTDIKKEKQFIIEIIYEL